MFSEIIKSYIAKFAEKLILCRSPQKLEELFQSYKLFMLYGDEVLPFCSTKLTHYNLCNVLSFMIVGDNINSAQHDPLASIASPDYCSQVIFTGISYPLAEVLRPIGEFEEVDNPDKLGEFLTMISSINIRPRNVWTDETGKIVGPNGNEEDMKIKLDSLKTKFGIHKTSINELINMFIHVIFPSRNGTITQVLKFKDDFNLRFFIKMEYLQKVVEKIFSPYEYKGKKNCFMYFKNIAFELTKIICGAIQFSIRYMGAHYLIPYRLFDIIFCNICLNMINNCGAKVSNSVFEVIETYYNELGDNGYINPAFKSIPVSACMLSPVKLSYPGSFKNYTPEKKETSPPRRGGKPSGRGGLKGKPKEDKPRYFKNKRGGLRGKPRGSPKKD